MTLVPLNYDEVVFHAIKFRYTSYRCVQLCMNIYTYTRDPFDRHVKGIKTWTIPVKKKDWYEKINMHLTVHPPLIYTCYNIDLYCLLFETYGRDVWLAIHRKSWLHDLENWEASFLLIFIYVVISKGKSLCSVKITGFNFQVLKLSV